MKRADEFPKNSFVLIPPSDLERLGQTVEDLGNRRARPTGQRCFDVAPMTGRGLSKIELSYKAGAEFKAEVEAVATQAGASLKSDDTATMVLDNITVKEGFGVPIRGSCGFHDGTQTINVITAVVVAGTARLEFSRNISFGGKLGRGWGIGSAEGSAGGNTVQSGQLQGANIIIAGAITPVEVTFSGKQQDLGITPRLGTVVTFPEGYDGNVRIDAFSTATLDDVPVLTMTANTRMNASAQNVPKNLQACTTGQSVSIKPGTGCFIWNGDGSSGINVWFKPVTVDGAEHFELHLDGYKSLFKPLVASM